MTQSEPGHAPASLAVAETIASQLQLVGARAEIAQSLAIARDEAITARAQKSQSLTRMSHEVLTPLNGLLGLNDLLAKTDLDREQRRLLSAQAVAGRELLSLVNDVLDFDNILEHGLRLDPSPFELDELLERARERCQTYLGEKPVTCTFVTDADVPLELVGDRARLLQLLDVLLSNAAKFTHSGEIAVHVSLAAGDPEATGRLRLDFTVRDTGIGIPETIAPGLFERFTQADTTTARSFGGAGLGLAIAREITDAMHGQLALTHVAEGGSEFSAVVELAVSDVAVAPIDGYAKRALAGRRVLIVEPDAGTLHRLKGLGHRWDLDVVAVPDPGAGWTALSEATDSGEPFAAAIIGLGRPGTAGPVGDDPGLGFAERIATDSTYDAVTMILISSGQVNLAEIRSLGVSVVLNHPVTTRALRGTLLEQVAGVSAEPSPEAESRAGRRNQRILIVEDNPVNQLVASGLLEANGFETVVASGGTEALTTLDDERVNAVLMDVQMPGMDGYETTRAIRGRPDAAARLPIIALTAAAVDGERQRCLSAGMDDYLAKPVEVESLVACLERWIGPAVAPPPAPTRTPTPPIDGLDTTRLDVLRDLDADNTDYLDRAIGNFASNSASGLATLEDLITQGSYDLVAAEAHKLVGSAFNLGVPRAGYAARAIEEAAREDRDGEIPDLLPELRDALVEGRRLLSQYQSTYAS